MIEAIRGQNWRIWLWGGLLNIPQVLGGLIFVRSAEGLLILVTVILTLLIAGQMHRREPFSRLIGLCHLPWIALLPWIVWRIMAVDHSGIQKAWMIYVVVTILVSLLFDTFDVVRYFRGDKRFSWAENGVSRSRDGTF